MKHLKKALKISAITLAALLFLYAVAFSVIGTYLVYKGYRYVKQPFLDVEALVSQNPSETSYMTLLRNQLRKAGKPDTLVHVFTPLDSISPYLKQTVIPPEETGFSVHPGF